MCQNIERALSSIVHQRQICQSDEALYFTQLKNKPQFYKTSLNPSPKWLKFNHDFLFLLFLDISILYVFNLTRPCHVQLRISPQNQGATEESTSPGLNTEDSEFKHGSMKYISPVCSSTVCLGDVLREICWSSRWVRVSFERDWLDSWFGKIEIDLERWWYQVSNEDV